MWLYVISLFSPKQGLHVFNSVFAKMNIACARENLGCYSRHLCWDWPLENKSGLFKTWQRSYLCQALKATDF